MTLWQIDKKQIVLLGGFIKDYDLGYKRTQKMTQGQIKDIQEKLSIWREEQKITIESQEADFRINLSEELREFYIAKKERDKHGMIDALCDMVIVSFNAGFIAYSDIYSEVRDDVDIVDIDCVTRGDRLEEIIALIHSFGYDPYKCLLEKIKNLNSRTQDEEQAWRWDILRKENAPAREYGKWKKALGAYTLSEAKEIAYDNPHSPKLVKEDDKYWIFLLYGADCGNYHKQHYLRISKWYRADYECCKLDTNN